MSTRTDLAIALTGGMMTTRLEQSLIYKLDASSAYPWIEQHVAVSQLTTHRAY
jgi:hypothetical protein